VGTGTTLVIPDTRSHPLLREQPEVAEQGIVAYLGVPLRGASGHVLGTLCVMDSQARVWSGRTCARSRTSPRRRW
jgi:GAF domain-containing protein